MTREKFIDVVKAGGAYRFTLNGDDGWGMLSFFGSDCEGITAVVDGVETFGKLVISSSPENIGVFNSAEELLERYKVNGIPFSELIPKIEDLIEVQTA